MAGLPEEILFRGCCPVCSLEFFICRPCYRGQRYCSARCRKVARRRKCQEYNRRHQETEAGREDHRARQRAQRLHRMGADEVEKSVTDHSRQASTEDGKVATGAGDENDPAAGTTASTGSPVGSEAGAGCQRCGRQSVLVEPLPEARAMLWKLRQGDRKATESRCVVSPPKERGSGRDYVRSVLGIYSSLPDTPKRTRGDDRYLALQWQRSGVPLFQIEGAMLLATARRVFREEGAEPLSPIRSLRYFVPALEEMKESKAGEGYVRYLREKLRPVMAPRVEMEGKESPRGPRRSNAYQLPLPW